MTKTMCDDCGETEFTIYNNDKGILCCRECGQFKEIANPLKINKEPVANFRCSDGLVATVPGMDNVEHFICRLIDHYEGETITEEFLHRRYADFLKWHEQKGN